MVKMNKNKKITIKKIFRADTLFSSFPHKLINDKLIKQSINQSINK